MATKEVLKELFLEESRSSIKEIEIALKELKKTPDNKELHDIIHGACHSLEGNSLLAGNHEMAYFVTKISRMAYQGELGFIEEFLKQLKQALSKVKTIAPESKAGSQKITKTIRKLEIVEKEKLRAQEKLRERLEELERFRKVTIGRELKMVELKEYTKELESRIRKSKNKK